MWGKMCPGPSEVSSISKKTLSVLTEALRWGPFLPLKWINTLPLCKILLDNIRRFLSLLQTWARFALSALWLGVNVESDSLNTSHIWLHCLSILLSSVVPDGAVWSTGILTRDGHEFYCCLAVCILWMWCRCTGCIWIFFFTLLFQCKFVLLGHFKESTLAKWKKSVKRKKD